MIWKKNATKEDSKEKIQIPDCGLICPRDEKKCAKWLVMYQHTTKEDGKVVTTATGRCSSAWVPMLMVELTQAIKGKQNDTAK